MIAGRSQLQPFAAASSQAGNNSYLARQRKRRARVAEANALPPLYMKDEEGNTALNEDGTVEIPEEANT